jgi:galactokinase
MRRTLTVSHDSHVDHMRFSCLPAALEMDILMAFRVTSNSCCSARDTITFHLSNTADRFDDTTFVANLGCSNSACDHINLQHSGSSRWANYFKVAFKGLLPHLPKSALQSSDRPNRVEVLVDGTIPPESSLSSSAAMTCCSSILILQAFQAREKIGRREMTEVAIESERLVGVNSGGMDQAASIFGLPGSALHVSFVPQLSVKAIELPRSHQAHTFIIANTLMTSDKKVMGPVQYNLRVGELRMACRALCKVLSLPQSDDTKVLKNLMEVYFEKNPLQRKGGGGNEEDDDEDVQQARRAYGLEAAKIVKMQKIALPRLPNKELGRSEVEDLTGYKGDAFDKEFLSEFPIKAETYKLHARVKHVLAESLRVLMFISACQCTHDVESSYQYLGKCMQDSQRSLLDDYENGCEELVKVCDLAVQHGALGCRPTGAGWGGSTIALVRQDKVEDVLQGLRKAYYKVNWPDQTDAEFSAAVLVSQPAGGACVYKVGH